MSRRHRRSQDLLWGALYSPKQVDDLYFLVVALKTEAETTKLTNPTIQISPISFKNWTLALQLYPINLAQNIFSVPWGCMCTPGYACDPRSLLL